MAQEAYKKQVALLLGVLPEVGRETCFALHGGTAINLFIRDMPRLSVDVDLAYVPMEDRAVSLANISAALERIKSRVETIIPNARAAHRRDAGKLQISAQGVNVKLEVNLVARGTLAAPVKMPLCAKAQKEFEAFCAVQIVPFGQLCEKEKKKLQCMLEDHKKLLCPNCEADKKKLGTTLELLQWKAENGVSDKGFEKLLIMLKKMLPKDNELPDSMYEVKKVV
jgi:hypothetical protein